jgi:hypothetical protein
VIGIEDREEEEFRRHEQIEDDSGDRDIAITQQLADKPIQQQPAEIRDENDHPGQPERTIREASQRADQRQFARHVALCVRRQLGPQFLEVTDECARVVGERWRVKRTRAVAHENLLEAITCHLPHAALHEEADGKPRYDRPPFEAADERWRHRNEQSTGDAGVDKTSNKRRLKALQVDVHPVSLRRTDLEGHREQAVSDKERAQGAADSGRPQRRSSEAFDGRIAGGQGRR